MGYNDMVISPPSVLEMPEIVNYVLPDSNQTIVSSWNCSEKVVSVGNIRNRTSFTDMNLTTTYGAFQSGELSVNSSKGPNRHLAIKPNVVATGDWSLGAGPLWLLQNPAYNSVIDSGAWHVRNGGTSMASPVISGIAALYLERCNRATYQHFLDDLQASSFADQFTGAVPNNFCGAGKANAFALLQGQTIPSQPIISWAGNSILSASPSDFYQWYLNGIALNGETDQTHQGVPPFGTYEVMAINSDGCTSLSNPYIASIGLEEVEIEPIFVTPNPSRSTIRVLSTLPLVQAIAIDGFGKQHPLPSIENNRFDTSKLAKGTYTLILISDSSVNRTRLVIQ